MIFDTQQRRIGFAESDCKFENVIKPIFPGFAFPTFQPSEASQLVPKEPLVGVAGNVCTGKPIDQCSAKCTQPSGTYQVTGVQDFATCKANCQVTCEGDYIARGTPNCVDSPWTECSEKCTQSRTVARQQEGSSQVPRRDSSPSTCHVDLMHHHIMLLSSIYLTVHL